MKKKKIRRVIALVLSLLLVMELFPTSVFATEVEKTDEEKVEIVNGESEESNGLDEVETIENDENKIELGRKAKNTIENAIETEEWIRKNNIKSIRLVTSSYHIPRSMQEFIIYVTKENDLEVILNPIYSPNVNHNWWKSWGTFRLLIMEYNKFLVVYLCRHLHIY